MKPLYQSIRASFSKDIYMPVCPVVAAPTVTLEVKNEADLALLTSEMPPQNVILPVARDLTVLGVDLYTALEKCSRSVPVLYFDEAETADKLAEFTFVNHVGDALLCVSYENRALLAAAYEKMPMLRGVLDCRGMTPDIEKLPAACVSNAATSVILDSAVAAAEAVHSLQQRFIHVIAGGDFGHRSIFIMLTIIYYNTRDC
jgi:hypothetical protein